MEYDSLVYVRLVQTACAGKQISYQDLAGSIGLDMTHPQDRKRLYRLLNNISSEENLAGRPLLSAVAVVPGICYPEMGFFLLARELGLNMFCDERSFYEYELKKVHEFWSNRYPLPQEWFKSMRKHSQFDESRV